MMEMKDFGEIIFLLNCLFGAVAGVVESRGRKFDLDIYIFLVLFFLKIKTYFLFVFLENYLLRVRGK